MEQRILVVLGATATGKSSLALALAERVGGEIVSADALQAYRDLDIGTAKPGSEERRRIRHHLIDILDLHEPYSAGEFARRARGALAEIRQRGRQPIVVGGSGLYLRALLEGLSPVPAGDPVVRQGLERRLAEEGLGALRQELEEVDSETAGRLAPGDTQRTLRALEVASVSGRPLSAWIGEEAAGGVAVAALRLGLTLPRPILYDRIADRVRAMLESGWKEEVERLLARGLDPSLPAFQAIGYRQLARHLTGEWSLQRAIDETIRETRRFAKRQVTWFRREKDVRWLRTRELGQRVSEAMEILQQEGLWRAHDEA